MVARNDHHAPQFVEGARQPAVVVVGHLVAVAFSRAHYMRRVRLVNVRRVAVVQGLRAVVLKHQVDGVAVLDHDALQPFAEGGHCHRVVGPVACRMA